MKIPKQVVETVDVAIVRVFVKVCDSGSYTLEGFNGQEVATSEDYVPSFFPGGGSDYLDLQINIETGQIINWKKPEPESVAKAFGLLKEEE